uniref:DDE_Tnp_1_7 domain-containing protein n=1 Tax=Elaeophora elaphi TaxID=1147741 RepID=A0A0R3S6E2_9BILA
MISAMTVLYIYRFFRCSAFPNSHCGQLLMKQANDIVQICCLDRTVIVKLNYRACNNSDQLHACIGIQKKAIMMSLLILISDRIYGNDDLRAEWKRSNAELINGLIGMDLGKLTKAGKRSISPIAPNDEGVSNDQRFHANFKKLWSSQRHC